MYTTLHDIVMFASRRQMSIQLLNSESNICLRTFSPVCCCLQAATVVTGRWLMDSIVNECTCTKKKKKQKNLILNPLSLVTLRTRMISCASESRISPPGLRPFCFHLFRFDIASHVSRFISKIHVLFVLYW